ncbi:TPA: hypothetical protein NGT37_001034 [Vibrio parahaemolyticus]|nr:hypothetical protein [Vibrio parahaemolyticus]
MNKKPSHTFTSETGSAAAKKQKRGLGKKTVFKMLAESAFSEANQQKVLEIYHDALAGTYGESTKMQMLTATYQHLLKLEELKYKAELDDEAKHEQMQRDITKSKTLSDLKRDDMLTVAACQALTRKWTTDELQAHIDRVLAEGENA